MEEFKSLKDTFIYSLTKNVEDNLKKILSKGNGTIVVTADMLDEVLREIKKRSFKSPVKYGVIDAIEKNKIKIVYNEKFILPIGLPFFKTKMGTPIINISKIASIDSDGQVINLDHRIFFSIVYSALLFSGNAMIENFHNKTLNKMYGGMFLNVVNKINIVEKNKKEVVKYLAIKFFIMSHMDEKERMAKDETISTIVRGMLQDANVIYLNEIDAKFELEWYDNLESFLLGLQELYPNDFGEYLTCKKFINTWMIMYGQLTTFSIEFPPFLYMTMILIYYRGVSRMDLIRYQNIETFIDRNIVKFINSLTL